MSDEFKEEPTPESVEVSPSRPGSFWKNLGILISGFAIVVLILTLGAGVFRLLKINSGFEKRLTVLQTQVGQSQDAVLQSQKISTQTQQQMTDQIKNQEKIISELRQSQQTSKDTLGAAEAEFLVKVANQSLLVQGDTALALRLLQQADKEISQLTDPKVFSIRESLSADMAALRSVPAVNTQELFLQLSGLDQQLDALSFAQQFGTQASPKLAPVDQNLSWWKRGLQFSGEQIQKIVIVRHNNIASMPFVTPDQQFFVLQNLHAKLATAQWALLHREPQIYQSSLQQLVDWVKKYAEVNSPVTQQVLASATQLSAVNIQPTPPELTHSLQAFQTYFGTHA